VSGEARHGYPYVVEELQQCFRNPDDFVKEKIKNFAKLFGDYLRVENMLQDYDEFAGLKALQGLDMSDSIGVEEALSKKREYASEKGLIEDLESLKKQIEAALKQTYVGVYALVADGF